MGGLMLISILGLAMTLTGLYHLVRRDYSEAKVMLIIGCLAMFLSGKAFVDMLSLYDSYETTESQVVQTEMLDSGQTMQFIINENGDVQKLDPRWWRPETTYYKIKHGQSTFFWLYEYNVQDIECFTVKQEDGE